jgi:hypothetical protein
MQHGSGTSARADQTRGNLLAAPSALIPDRLPELSRNRLNYRVQASEIGKSKTLLLAQTTVTGQSSRFGSQTVNYWHFLNLRAITTPRFQ